MKILVYANESVGSGMTVGEFINSVKAIYNKYFADSECVAQNLKVLGMEYIGIKWYLSKDRSETAHGIRDNDMLWVTFNIDLEDNTESGRVYDMYIYDNSSKNDRPMPGTITLEVKQKSYLTSPEVKYMAYGRRDLPYRKTTGTPQKILNTLDKYAQKLHASLEADLASGVIHPNHQELVRAKL